MRAGRAQDPFPQDPDDDWPGLEDHEPLTESERAELLDDLSSLETFQQILEPTGIRGLVVECPDCREPHFFEWGLLRNNLTHVLGDNSPRIHEPAFNPDPDDYVTWDYARGYVDCWQDVFHEFGDRSEDPEDLPGGTALGSHERFRVGEPSATPHQP